MLVSNDDVANGHANGTRVILRSAVLKPSASVDIEKVDGKPCRIVSADDVDHLICHLDGDETKIFKIASKKMTCVVKAPIPTYLGSLSSATIQLTVQMTQFPMIPNYATTGHKLHGQTKEALVVSVWSKRRNWNYVALSRVKTRKGLFLVNKLPYDADFSIPPDLTQMMLLLQQKVPPDDCGIDFDEERANRNGMPHRARR